MSRLTPDGQRALAEICRRYGVSENTGLSLLDELARNNGTMAQFNLPELGGSGQWMAGGMTMVGDMFNHGLKAQVDGLCQELAGLLATAPYRPAPAPQQGLGVTVSLGPGAGGAGQWWPAELGQPDWQGSQNSMRYAFFSRANRLVLDVGGAVSIYDTSGFTLSGVGQQQSSGTGSSLTFTGPGGLVTLERLRRVDTPRAEPGPGTEPVRSFAASAAIPAPAPTPAPAPAPLSKPGPKPAAAGRSDTEDGLTGQRWWYHGPEGAEPVLLTFAADGILAGSEKRSLQYWEQEDGALTLYAADGRATARFGDVKAAASAAELTGASPPGSGTPVALRPAAATAPLAETPSLLDGVVLVLHCTVTAGAWVFAQDGGPDIATVTLQADGRVSNHTRPTEAGWRLDKDGTQFLFLHKSGRPTARFASVTVEDGRWTLRGASLAQPEIRYVLRQV